MLHGCVAEYLRRIDKKYLSIVCLSVDNINWCLYAIVPRLFEGHEFHTNYDGISNNNQHIHLNKMKTPKQQQSEIDTQSSEIYLYDASRIALSEWTF
jgi:hypothetical protein